jgi:hypothetical protein
MKTFICCLINNTNTFFISSWLGLSQHLSKVEVPKVQKKVQKVQSRTAVFWQESFDYLSASSRKREC